MSLEQKSKIHWFVFVENMGDFRHDQRILGDARRTSTRKYKNRGFDKLISFCGKLKVGPQLKNPSKNSTCKKK